MWFKANNFEKVNSLVSCCSEDLYNDFVKRFNMSEISDNWVNAVKCFPYLKSFIPFGYPLLNHMSFFRNDKYYFLVSQPYLSAEDIVKSQIPFKYNQCYILGKNKSFYDVNESNLVVFQIARK